MPSSRAPSARDASAAEPAEGRFEVHLDVFEGPFHVLLGLIARHQLDVTEVALARVTDEFIAFTRTAGPAWDLGEATEFLVVAATLLDLKAARLLPKGEVEDPEDLALLEARDLLFARLLQYRAYQQAAGTLSALLAAEELRHPRSVALEERYVAAAREATTAIDPARLAALAAAALAPRRPAEVPVDHVHAPAVSVREQVLVLARRLLRAGTATFGWLVRDCTARAEVVGRFLGVLELFRDGDVALEQSTPYGNLHVRWTGPPTGPSASSTGEYDDTLPPVPARTGPR